MLYTDGRRKSHLAATPATAPGAEISIQEPNASLQIRGLHVHVSTRGAVKDHARLLRAGAASLRSLARGRPDDPGAAQLAALADLTDRAADLCYKALQGEPSAQEMLIRNARFAWLCEKDLRTAFDLVVRARAAGPLSPDVEELAAPLEVRFDRVGWNSRGEGLEEVPHAA